MDIRVNAPPPPRTPGECARDECWRRAMEEHAELWRKLTVACNEAAESLRALAEELEEEDGDA